MPYVMTRDEPSLKLKAGAELKHENGKLPAALKFSAAWQEPEAEVKTDNPKKSK